MLKVISFDLLLLVRLRFQVNKSTAYVLRSTYWNTVVKDIRKFEKTDFALRKCKLDLLFLEACLENQVIPKLLNFHVLIYTLKLHVLIMLVNLSYYKKKFQSNDQEGRLWRKILLPIKES